MVMPRDFDPSKEIFDDESIVYEDFADFLIGKPVECQRNRDIRGIRVVAHDGHTFIGKEGTLVGLDEYCAYYAEAHDREGRWLFSSTAMSSTFTGTVCVPAFATVVTTGGAWSHTVCGTGLTSVVSTPLDPFHPAYQPQVPRWVGP